MLTKNNPFPNNETCNDFEYSLCFENKISKNIDFKSPFASYSLFEYENKSENVVWNLISNVYKTEEESEDEPKNKKKPFPPKKKDDESDVEPEADGDSEIKKNPKTADKKAEISKIESVDTRSAFEQMWSAFAEAIDPKKGALAGEKYDDHSSEHDKKVIAMHKKSEKKYEDDEEDGHTKTFKAGGKDMKQAPARSGADNLSNGDKTPKK